VVHKRDIAVVSLKTTLQPQATMAMCTGRQQVLAIDAQGGPVFFKDFDPVDLLDGKKNIEITKDEGFCCSRHALNLYCYVNRKAHVLHHSL